MTDRTQIAPGLRVDHVLFMGEDLDAMTDAFERIGIEPEYGGEHSNGITHNSLVGFDDGSYLELISTVERDAEFEPFDVFIKNNAGPSAWAIEPDDITAWADRLAETGVEVGTVIRDSRETPDGDLAEWEMVEVGGDRWGTKLPFLITDVGPRDHRITPTESVADSELSGVGVVVVAVENLDASLTLYERSFGIEDFETAEDEGFDMRMAHVPGTAVILAEQAGDGWLATRLEQFGEGPCAFLLASTDMDRSLADRPLEGKTNWFDREVAWFSVPEFHGKLGVIG